MEGALAVAGSSAEERMAAVGRGAEERARQAVQGEMRRDRSLARVLSVEDAQFAAAAGARSAVAVMEHHLRPPRLLRFRWFNMRAARRLEMAEKSAARGAVAGLQAATLMAAANQRAGASDGEVIRPDATPSALRPDARAAPSTPGLSVSNWTRFLVPFIGGSLPACVGMYQMMRTSSSIIANSCLFGVTTLAVIVVSYVLLPGLPFPGLAGTTRYHMTAVVTSLIILLGLMVLGIVKLCEQPGSVVATPRM